MMEEPVEDIQARLRDLISQHQEAGWEKAWESSSTPWDRIGCSQPPLRSLLESNELDWPRQPGRALVPGCGRGYDATLIASALGLHVVGTDISKTAVESARKLLAEQPDVPSNLVEFRKVDFFGLHADEQNQYDLVYDYTFFVAIPPSKRPDWARQMDALVKPGGFFITLVYPIQPHNTQGPPFYVRPEHYVELLLEKWDKIIDRVPDNSQSTHVGKEHLLVWRKR